MGQWNEDPLLSQPLFGHELPHNRVATGVLMFSAQSLKNEPGRVPRLLENPTVI
jgi:hypothetical protein